MATAVANAEPAQRRWTLPERLPEIRGRALIAYRVIWLAVATLALISTTYFNYQWTALQLAGSRTFFDAGLAPIQRYADGQHVRAVSPQARLAGVGEDAAIMSINGRAAPDDDDTLAALLDGPDGSSISVGLRDASGRTRNVTLTRSSSYAREAYAGSGLTLSRLYWIEFAIDAGANLLYLCAAALLFIRRPGDTVAGLLSLGMLFYLINVQTAVPSLVLAAAVGSVSGSMLLLGFLFFPDGRLAPRWWPVAALAIFSAAVLNIAAYWNSAALTAVPFVTFLAVILISVAVVGRFRAAAPVVRQQIKFAMLGLIASVGCAALGVALTHAGLFAATEGGRSWFNLFGSLAGSLDAVAIAGGLLIALLRFRLYDVDSAIGRSAAYGLLTIGFVVLFALSEKLIELLGQEYFGQNVGALAGGVAAALAAVMIAPMHKRSHRWAEKRFQKGLFRLRHILPPLVGDLRETAGLEQIAGATLDSVLEGVRARHVALIACDELIGARNVPAEQAKEWWRSWTPAVHDGIDTERTDTLFPVRVPLEAEGHGRVGWILLGSRPDGSLFGKSECRAIEEIAEPVARAVEVARRRNERDEHIEARLQRIERRLAKLTGKTNPRSRPAAVA